MEEDKWKISSFAKRLPIVGTIVERCEQVVTETRLRIREYVDTRFEAAVVEQRENIQKQISEIELSLRERTKQMQIKAQEQQEEVFAQLRRLNEAKLDGYASGLDKAFSFIKDMKEGDMLDDLSSHISDAQTKIKDGTVTAATKVAQAGSKALDKAEDTVENGTTTLTDMQVDLDALTPSDDDKE